jgi:hypothetical protein
VAKPAPPDVEALRLTTAPEHSCKDAGLTETEPEIKVGAAFKVISKEYTPLTAPVAEFFTVNAPLYTPAPKLPGTAMVNVPDEPDIVPDENGTSVKPEACAKAPHVMEYWFGDPVVEI